MRPFFQVPCNQRTTILDDRQLEAAMIATTDLYAVAMIGLGIAMIVVAAGVMSAAMIATGTRRRPTIDTADQTNSTTQFPFRLHLV